MAKQTGKGSCYSQYLGHYRWTDDEDEPNSCALGCPDWAQGVSFYDRKTLGKWFLVTAPNGIQSLEQQTEIGPSPRTGRKIDISAVAAERFGYSPHNFPTDKIFSWMATDPPEEVANLMPKRQAIAFATIRHKEST